MSMNHPNLSDIDDCESRPCQNDGECKDQVNSFKCNCKEGYTGLRCETGDWNPLKYLRMREKSFMIVFNDHEWIIDVNYIHMMSSKDHIIVY